MEINKENVQKAIDFLKTLAPTSFIANEQTKNDDKENIGKFHCVYGHLILNPASPFYDKRGRTYSLGADNFPFKLNYATEEVGKALHEVNNEANDENRKQAVIEHLEKFYATLTE